MINEGDFHRHNYVTEKEQSAVNGTFMFNNLQITLIPGTYALLVFQIHDLEINGIAKDFVESPEMMVVFIGIVKLVKNRRLKGLVENVDSESI